MDFKIRSRWGNDGLAGATGMAGGTPLIESGILGHALGLAPGIFVAHLLARGQFFGKQILNGLVHLPLVMPPVVTGYLLLVGFAPNSPLGGLFSQIGVTFAFRWTGAALAAAIMGFPLMVRAIRLSIEAVDPKLEQAAATLGASRVWVFFTVTLPLILPGVLTGAILAFAKAMGEFGATITFVSNIPGQTQTLPSAIYAFLQVPGGEASATRLVIISIIIAMAALIASEVLARQLAKRIGGRMLEVTLKHRFSGTELDLSFSTPEGLTVLYGASGSGKTTVINAVAGLLRPDQGRVVLGDTVLGDTNQNLWLPPHKRGLGYVFQEARLFPHLTVRQNLAFGAWFARNRPAPKGAAGFEQVVDMLGIGPLLTRRPATLSGGEKQRVAIGRALLARPRMLLADEPLSALDQARKSEILPYFERLRDEVALPILYVCHAPEEVARLATTVVALDQGRVLQTGPAEKLLADPGFAPQGPRAVGALLRAKVAVHHDDGLTELDAGGVPLFVPRIPQQPGHALRLRIAAQDVILARDLPRDMSALNVLPGVIDDLRMGDGPGAIVALSTPAGKLLARITRRSAQSMGLAPGQKMNAIVKTVAIAPEDVGR